MLRNKLDFVLTLCVNKMATELRWDWESWRQLGQCGDGGPLPQPQPAPVQQRIRPELPVRCGRVIGGAEVAREPGHGERAVDRLDTQLTPGTQPWPARSSTPSTISLRHTHTLTH